MAKSSITLEVRPANYDAWTRQVCTVAEVLILQQSGIACKQHHRVLVGKRVSIILNKIGILLECPVDGCDSAVVLSGLELNERRP